MKFEEVLPACKDGLRIARHGWNGRSMWVCFTKPRTVALLEAYAMQITAACGHFAKLIESGAPAYLQIAGHFDMRTADGTICMGWLASQTDLATTDWYILADGVDL